MDWWNLMKQSVTVGAQLLWGGHYGCNNGRYGCTIVMSYIEINKAVSQWLLTFNLCVSVTWPLTCAFHIPCTHTPEITDMHRGMCDNMPTPNHKGQFIAHNTFKIVFFHGSSAKTLQPQKIWTFCKHNFNIIYRCDGKGFLSLNLYMPMCLQTCL